MCSNKNIDVALICPIKLNDAPNLRVTGRPANICQLCAGIAVDIFECAALLSLFGSRSWHAEIPSHLSKIPSMLTGRSCSGRLRCASVSGGKSRRKSGVPFGLQKAEARDGEQNTASLAGHWLVSERFSSVAVGCALPTAEVLCSVLS